MSKKSGGERNWTVMVYLAGENNLAEECVHALKEMKRARPGVGYGREDNAHKRVKVIAQLDASGLGGREARYILEGEDVDGTLEQCVIATRDTSETSYRGVLKDFISTSILESDGDGLAENYMLVLAGHGGGVDSSDFLSRDIDTPDTLSIPKIQWVLQQVRADIREAELRNAGAGAGSKPFRVNVLGLDSCLMSMAEIGYELRDYVDFMVGAEGFEPNTGWPYERILSDILSDHEELQPRRLAELIVERYVAYYRDFLPAGRSVDQAAADLSVMRGARFVRAMRELARVLKDKLNPDKTPEAVRQIVLAHWEAQSYKDDQYVDLYDFCDLLDRGFDDSPTDEQTGSVILRGAAVDEEIAEACREVKRVLKGSADKAGPGGAGDPAAPREGVILKSCYSGPAVQHSHGLSVYFPWSNVIETYRDLEFARDTGWYEFLLHYVDVTRRRKRPCTRRLKSDVLKSTLFFNRRVSGFDFLPAENRNVPFTDRILRNRVGTMKNPALEHVVCACSAQEMADSEETPAAAAESAGEYGESPAVFESQAPAKNHGKARAKSSGRSAQKH